MVGRWVQVNADARVRLRIMGTFGLEAAPTLPGLFRGQDRGARAVVVKIRAQYNLRLEE